MVGISLKDEVVAGDCPGMKRYCFKII